MSPLAPLPLSNWLLPPFRFSRPLRLVPTWGEIGATIGPETAPAPAIAPTEPANALDCAPSLSRSVWEEFPLTCSTEPEPALPLSRWLAKRLPLAGPLTLVPTCGVTGATIGPDTATPPAPTRPTAAESDCAPRSSTCVRASLRLACETLPPLPLPLGSWLLMPWTSSGPLTFVPTCGAIGATTGPATPTPSTPPPNASDWAFALFRNVAERLVLSCPTPPPKPLPLSRWLLNSCAVPGPLTFVPTCGETGTTTGPAAPTPTRPAAAAWDWAPWLSTEVIELLKLLWRTPPSPALPLAAWLLAPLTFSGPLRLVPTCGLIGATIGPATATPPMAPAEDCARALSSMVDDSLALTCSRPPVLPLPLSRWLLSTFPLTGPLTFVPTCGEIGATIGPDTATTPPAVDWG